jgi:uncharacterized protein
VSLAQATSYPWDGHVSLRVDPDRPRAFELQVRVPGWARNRPVPSELYRYVDSRTAAPTLAVNEQPVPIELTRGYAVVARTWRPGDVLTLELPMEPRRVVADERVADDRGRIALERGPLVYCTEGADNGGSVLELALADGAAIRPKARPDLLGGLTVLETTARTPDGKTRPMMAIPYYAWSHRGPGEMAVWLRRHAVR